MAFFGMSRKGIVGQWFSTLRACKVRLQKRWSLVGEAQCEWPSGQNSARLPTAVVVSFLFIFRSEGWVPIVLHFGILPVDRVFAWGRVFALRLCFSLLGAYACERVSCGAVETSRQRRRHSGPDPRPASVSHRTFPWTSGSTFRLFFFVTFYFFDADEYLFPAVFVPRAACCFTVLCALRFLGFFVAALP